MTPSVPIWRQALRLLDEGRPSAEVLEWLAGEAPTGSVLDHRVAAALRTELTPASGRVGPDSDAEPAPDPARGPDADPDADSDTPDGPDTRSVARDVLSTLDAMTRGRRALREGEVDELVRAVGEADAALPAGMPWLQLRVASLFQAAFRFSGDRALLDRGLDRARPVADDLDRPTMAVAGRSILATLHLLTGRFHAVSECCDAALELARAARIDDRRFVAMAHQFRGYALLEWSRLDEARSELEKAWSLTGPDAPGVRTGVARMLATIHSARGEHAEARRWLRELEAMLEEPITLRNREWLAAVRVRVGVRTRRDLRTVDRWRHGYAYDELAHGDGPPAASRLHELESLMSVLEIFGQWGQVRTVAAILLEGSRPSRSWFAARALSGRAVALARQGRRPEALDAMREGLEIGRPGGFVRCYAEGDPVRRSLLDTLREAGDPDAERVAEALEGEPDEASVELTPKQLEVLRLVATGLSNRELAARLRIAETTVKTHLREIYARLDVGSRTAAVAAARARGLLQS